MPIYRTGLMIIRAWVEKGSHRPLRAHIRATSDLSKGLDSELTVTDAATASDKVGTWLDDVQNAAEQDDQVAKEKRP